MEVPATVKKSLWEALKALLSLVALWGLIPVPHLLHLLILHWSVLWVPLRACISEVASVTTLEANITHLSIGSIRPCWSA